MTDQTPLPPPGWYPDAEVPAGERWWNGAGWSEDRRSAPPPVGPPPSPYTGAPIAASPYVAAPYGAAGPANTPAMVGFWLAVSAMVLGWILGIIGTGLAIAALILSILGLRRAGVLAAQGHAVDRRGFALAGVILAGLALLGTLLLTVGFFALTFLAPASGY